MPSLPTDRGGRRVALVGVVAGVVGAIAAVIAVLVPPIFGDDDAAPPRPTDTGAADSTGSTGSTGSADTSEPTSAPGGDPGFVAFTSRETGRDRGIVLAVASRSRDPIWGGRDATDASATPDGATVAAVVEDDAGPVIAVGDPGGEPRTFDVEGTPSDTAISPDGSTVAYVTDAGGDDDVVVLDVDSGDRDVIAGGTADESDPAWDAEGARLAYVRSGSSSDVIVVVPLAAGADGASIDVGGSARSPSFMPDGRSVVYVGEVAGNREVLVRSLDGGDPSNISQSPAEETGVVALLDGQVVTSAPDRGLLRVDPSGGSEPQELTTSSGDAL